MRHRRTVEGRQATKETGQAITILYVTLPIMPPPYSLRFPFRLPSDRAIGCDTTPRLLGHLVIRIDDKTKPYYAFVIDGFSSEDEANQFIPKLWTGLRWLLMTNGIAVSAQRTLQTVTYVDDPVEAANNPAKSFGGSNETPVDCLIDGYVVVEAINDRQNLIFRSHWCLSKRHNTHSTTRARFRVTPSHPKLARLCRPASHKTAGVRHRKPFSGGSP